MSLPFENAAQIKARDGSVVASCRVSVFRDGESTGATGQEVTFSCFATKDAAVAEGRQNLLLEVGGETYRILDATFHRFLSYVRLTLRQVNPSG